MSKKAEKIVEDFIDTIEEKYPFIKCTFTKNGHIAILLNNLQNNKKTFVYTSSTPSDQNFPRVLARHFNDALLKLDVDKLQIKHDFKISFCAGVGNHEIDKIK
jgi:hypothetical protein